MLHVMRPSKANTWLKGCSCRSVSVCTGRQPALLQLQLMLCMQKRTSWYKAKGLGLLVHGLASLNSRVHSLVCSVLCACTDHDALECCSVQFFRGFLNVLLPAVACCTACLLYG
jgi:hypothetical protein